MLEFRTNAGFDGARRVTEKLLSMRATSDIFGLSDGSLWMHNKPMWMHRMTSCLGHWRDILSACDPTSVPMGLIHAEELGEAKVRDLWVHPRVFVKIDKPSSNSFYKLVSPLPKSELFRKISNIFLWILLTFHIVEDSLSGNPFGILLLK
ncbi:unnamed protein product [Spirodela intermedia]|uniref:Uncharacterized protein n=2 Tax=Spirodela intermedia TaxID=51605 RepID=A0A7I8IFY1_SPIIN|nr:unnamed protein product [Spirodela intermedia]CAA6656541.1 unnamed protein product [Spirodela intermedia]CAA7392126.1 unnamed protein product [Spirodela intermedia]